MRKSADFHKRFTNIFSELPKIGEGLTRKKSTNRAKKSGFFLSLEGWGLLAGQKTCRVGAFWRKGPAEGAGNPNCESRFLLVLR
jgi:hypothetical protein